MEPVSEPLALWKLRKSLSPVQIGWLWLGLSPAASPKPTARLRECRMVVTAIEAAIANRELPFSILRGYDEHEDEEYEVPRVTRWAVACWARKRGLEVPEFFRDAIEDDEVGVQGPSPVDAYTTPLLEALRRAIAEFWLCDSPQKGKKSAFIIGWLEDQGISNRAAIAIDLIIRPEDKRKGGQTKPADLEE